MQQHLWHSNESRGKCCKSVPENKSVTADQGISVTDCTTPASLTVATTNFQSNGYVYPALNEATGNQQKDFALWMKVGDKGVSSYNAPIELANGTYPIELQMIKISNNYKKIILVHGVRNTL